MALYVSAAPVSCRENLPLMFIIIFLLPSANSIKFKFTKFNPNQPSEIVYQGDACSSNGVIELTKNQQDATLNLNGSTGRAIYREPVPLWDSQTRTLTDFNTHFSFIIEGLNSSDHGGGLAFFLAPSGSEIPRASGGGYLGIFNYSLNTSDTQIVAVEFDTYVNINSIDSVAAKGWESSMKNGSKANAWVSYNASTKNLSVFLTYDENPVFGGDSTLSCTVDLMEILPERVSVGFSAATGLSFEAHQVLSWEFNSTLEMISKKMEISSLTSTSVTTYDGGNSTLETSKGFGNYILDDDEEGSSTSENFQGENWKATGLVVGLVVGVVVLIVGLGVWVCFRRKLRRTKKKEEAAAISMERTNTLQSAAIDLEMDDDEFESGATPKSFSYGELALATGNFSDDRKLGEGGFGAVYKGFLRRLRLEVAVKRISKDSKQGIKEYVSEVKIISQLRHRNLVQLLGWCHEHGDFLLVYEFMPNGSLDHHLFDQGKSLLKWPKRYEIVAGLASALLYLHEEWVECVLHRDIKSSNVLLDSSLNAKLGDFGLARLVAHEFGSQTTIPAGTPGYWAPESLATGKSTKEGDVYSFGVVALEIACGRRSLEPNAEKSKVIMVDWLWDLYGRGMLLEAADKRLQKEFREEEMERLMALGLWCAHPDCNKRPSIRQVIGVLNWEAPLPSLQHKMPETKYFPLSMNPSEVYNAWTAAVDTNSDRDGTGSSYSTRNTSLYFTGSPTYSTRALLR